MTKQYQNLPAQLEGYAALTQTKLDEYQAVLLRERSTDTPDVAALSKAMGAIFTIGMYESYLDTICASYGFIDREFMAREYDCVMSAQEFDEWVEDQQEWFTESMNLPAEPSVFPCLMSWLDDFFTNELLLPDSTLNEQVSLKAAEEFADYNETELRQGMLLHLQWIANTLTPALMPPSWKEDDTPEIYKAIALGGLTRRLN